MLQVRFNLITADPLRLGDMAKFVEAEVRPGVESLHGSLGMLLAAKKQAGVAILQTFWASRETLLLSRDLVAPLRGAVVRRAGGTVRVERYRVPVFEQEGDQIDGTGLRLTSMDIEPDRTEDLAEVYGDIAVPALAETAGFCAALPLVDRHTGHSIGETVWRTPQVLAASRGVDAAAGAQNAASTGCVTGGVDEYDLVFSSARKPRH